MTKQEVVLVLGGTGFIGRAVVEKYLDSGWRVAITTRKSVGGAKERLLIHGFNSDKLEQFVDNKQLLIMRSVDLSNVEWRHIKKWLKAFSDIKLLPESILRVVNLVGDTSGSTESITKTNIDVLDSIFELVGYLKSKSAGTVFCNMGSTVELRKGLHLSPYDRSKKIARRRVDSSGLCDYHFIANYIKGTGEQKMKSAAPHLWKKLKISHKWLFGFDVSVVDVNDFAEVVYEIPELMKTPRSGQPPVEVHVSSGELRLGEVVENLLPANQRVIPRAILSPGLEKYFLRIYALLIPWIRPRNQIARRLANFAKRASLDPNRQEMFRTFKTAEEIKRFALYKKSYLTIEKEPFLIISSKRSPIVYVLKEKSKEELRQIVRKAVIL